MTAEKMLPHRLHGYMMPFSNNYVCVPTRSDINAGLSECIKSSPSRETTFEETAITALLHFSLPILVLSFSDLHIAFDFFYKSNLFVYRFFSFHSERIRSFNSCLQSIVLHVG